MEWLLAMFLVGIGGVLLSIAAAIGERRGSGLAREADLQWHPVTVTEHAPDDV